MILFTIYLITGLLTGNNALNYQYNQRDYYTEDNTLDEPLFLTPYIESGKIEYAQKLAKVSNLKNVDNIDSYSGYLTVNKTCNSNMFFWFFPAQVNYSTAPIFLWLQGGPGASSMFGLFEEIGPILVNDNNEIESRNYTWNKFASLLFIDNPVGTGFSFTDMDECYAKNENDVRKDLYNALVQFFKLFPKLQKNDFYLSGESYAGKYIPAIGYSIHENNPKSDIKINLKGLFIGDGWSDPVNMLVYSKYLYQLGFLDEQQRDILNDLEKKVVESIKNEQWKEANEYYNIAMSIVTGITYEINISYYNFIKPIYNFDRYVPYLTSNDTRNAIHVGNMRFNNTSNTVYAHLGSDFLHSVKPWLEELVENYQIILYNGQLDVIVAFPLTENYVQQLNWSGAHEYYNASRYALLVGDDKSYNVAAFGKFVKNLSVVVIRNAGHMAPLDQPMWTYQTITSLLERFNNEETNAEHVWKKIK